MRVSCSLILVVALGACMQTRYVLQAGLGQAELWSLARPLDNVIDDPDTDERTRVLLKESQVIMRFAQDRGLERKGNYEKFVELDRGQVVWFLAAANPLKMEAIVWNFPLVGSFPYLGWFDKREAMQIRRRLAKRGLDVYTRPVHAYSTGGWLDDPILSTMLSPEDDAFRYLSNILLHELTHANLLVNDQATLNESIASFVGDTMAEEYIAWRFGEKSEELRLYRKERAEAATRGARFSEAYAVLSTLYASPKTDLEKLETKERITRALERDLNLSWQPNNASLQGFKIYNTGTSAFEHLYSVCGQSWPRFFTAIKKLKPNDFEKEQMEDLDDVIATAERWCLPASN